MPYIASEVVQEAIRSPVALSAEKKMEKTAFTETESLFYEPCFLSAA